MYWDVVLSRDVVGLYCVEDSKSGGSGICKFINLERWGIGAIDI